MEVVLNSRAEAGTENEHPEPIPIEEQCDILIDAFGERRGTEVREAGGGIRRAPKKRGPIGRDEAAQKRQQLEVQAQQAEDRAKKAEEEARKAKEEAQQANAKYEEMQKRMEAFESQLRAVTASQVLTASQRPSEVVDFGTS